MKEKQEREGQKDEGRKMGRKVEARGVKVMLFFKGNEFHG